MKHKNRFSLILLTSFFTATTAFAGGISYSPYKDMTLNAHWSQEAGTMVPEDLNLISQQSGIKDFTLAFIVSSTAQACTPSWGGSYPMTVKPEGKPEYVWGLSDINQLKQAGGDVIISFGGQSQGYLSQTCTTAIDLQNAYAKVMNTYHVKKLDFDVEGGTLSDTATITKMMTAIAGLQKQYADLSVSFTLPVLPSGLTPNGVNLLRTAYDNGINLARVNIMSMDYGPSFAPDQMAVHAEQAAAATFAQLKSVYPNATYTMIGITPMLGMNDVIPERFTLHDVKSLVDFAKKNNINFLGSWSVNRDHPCDAEKWASPTCSGAFNGKKMQESAYDFSKTFLSNIAGY